MNKTWWIKQGSDLDLILHTINMAEQTGANVLTYSPDENHTCTVAKDGHEKTGFYRLDGGKNERFKEKV